MSEQKSTTAKFLLIFIAALTMVVGVQAWYMAGIHKKLNQIQAGNLTSVWSVDPGNSSAPLNDKWFDRPFDPDGWDPFQEMQQMQDHINSMFGDTFGRFGRSTRFSGLFGSSGFSPNIDIQEKKDRFDIHVDLPGAQNNNVNVKLEDLQLTISGTLDQQQDSSHGKVLRRERRSGKFSRSITLPAPVKAGEMKTHFEKGVLKITIPKA